MSMSKSLATVVAMAMIPVVSAGESRPPTKRKTRKSCSAPLTLGPMGLAVPTTFWPRIPPAAAQ
ncbi:DhnA family fructose-bisphosphate aldolase class Ia [Rhizobium mongolense]|uniref:DhnA family fructose-bisphosphate aldolase class Ia n=1 Tax=Rhizobium mongolense TaxID=57676 RepID=A0ABR6ILW1_9HYPH|nr:DhnA family fructose-bisphosphate aldolase class Ia [Rhizobium mongolense]